LAFGSQVDAGRLLQTHQCKGSCVTFRHDEPHIGDVMRKFAPFLKLYSEYVTNFDNAMETMTYWLEKCPRFQQIVKDIQVC